MNEYLSHSEFVRASKSGQLEVSVDRYKALLMVESGKMPKRYRLAHLFWSWIWFISIPISLAVVVFYEWWVGLILLLIVTPAISSSTKKSAMQFMIDHSVESNEFYNFAVSEEIIIVKLK